MVDINGQSQPGWTSTPVVELNGSKAGGSASGLDLRGGSSTVRGLIINRFKQHDITLATGGSNTVQGNWIGLGSNGNTRVGNTLHGVDVNSTGTGTQVRGTGSSAGNVISGNVRCGVLLRNAAPVTVLGNRIGTNVAGTAAVAHCDYGITIDGGAHVIGDGTPFGATPAWASTSTATALPPMVGPPPRGNPTC